MDHQLKAAGLAAVLASLTLAHPAARDQIFRGGTDVVLLTITVFDAGTRLVAGLDQEDFEVYEDGVRQDISNFSRLPQPIALSLLVDTSASMDSKLPIAQQAATGFVRRMGEKDIAQIIDFDSQAKILLSFTDDKPALERAIRRFEAGGATSLYNAVYTALSELKRIRAETGPDLRRQAIVLLSDGQDTSSIVPYEDVLDAAKRSDIALYAIGLSDKDATAPGEWKESDFVLRTLAQETGGKAYFAKDAAQLPSIYGQIADELATQYTLGYVSKSTKRDGAWRRIAVKIARPNMTARTKAGYFGPKAQK